jgi:hypothetical protein
MKLTHVKQSTTLCTKQPKGLYIPSTIHIKVINMPDYMVNAYAESEVEAYANLWNILCRKKPSESGTWEIWEIEPNRYGLRYVVITRRKTVGKPPKITLKRMVARVQKK